MSDQAIRVILLDDEESLRKPLNDYLCKVHGFDVDAVANGNDALHLIERANGYYDIALLDEVLADGPSGLDVLRQIKAKYAEIDVILFTGWGMQAGIEALQAGAYRYFAKPFDKDELAMTIRFATEQKRIRKEHDYMESLVKSSQALTQTNLLEKQLEIIWDFVREQLSTPTCFVALYNSQTDMVEFPLSYDEGKVDPLPQITLGSEQSNWGLAGFVIKTGQEQVWFTHEQAEKDWQNLGIKSRFSLNGPSESGICLPLKTSDEIWGALSVQSYESYAFDQALLNAVRALGNQVAVTLENSRLIRDAKQKALSLEKLQNLTLAINSTLDLKDVLAQVCQAAVELASVDHSGLVVFEPDLSRGSVVAEYPADTQTSNNVILVRGVPAEENLVFQQEVLNIYDVRHELSLGLVRDILVDSNICSTLIVPVIFNGKVVASFSLDTIREQRVFSKNEIEICQNLANQAAVAIQNARLYNEMKEGREYLQSLYQATTEIISPRHPDDVLQHIVETACRKTGAWRASIILISKSKLPRVLGSFGFENRLELAGDIRSDGITMKIIQSGQARFFRSTEAAADMVNPAMIAQGSKAAACLPLILQGENIGVLWIQFLEEHIFSETECHALQLYANQSAVAYDNSRHMHELDQLRESAEAMAGADEPKQVLQRIAEGARRVLGADAALIWSYDSHREDGVFLPDELVADGISDEQLESFRQDEPKIGRTTRYILDVGYLKVTNVSSAAEIGDATRSLLSNLEIKSFQSIRLDVAGEPLGVLYVDYKLSRDFAQEERQILEHFANQAALTLKKTRLLKQVKRAHQAARIVSAVITIGNLEDTLQEIVTGARGVLDCDVVTIYTFDEKGQKFVHFAGTGYNEKSNLRHPKEVAVNSALWRIIDLERPFYHTSENVSDDRLLQGGFVRNEHIQSALGIQLRFQEERVGVMFINYRMGHRFTQDEIDDALLFGNQAAVAIRNVQLHEKTKKQTVTLEGLYRAGETVTGLLTLNEILQTIAEQAWRLVGLGSAYTAIRLIENDVAKVVATYPEYDSVLTHPKIPEIDLKLGVMGRIGVTGRAVVTGESQLINDVHSDADYIPSDPQIRSEIAVPIILDSHVIGVINVDSPEYGAFDENDEHTLVSLARYAAIAINNAQLHEKTIDHMETLGYLYESGNSITRSLAVHDVLDHIAEQALHIVHANANNECFSHVALLEKSRLRFVASYPYSILQDLQTNIGELTLHPNSQQGIAGHVASTGKPLKADDVTKDHHYIALRETAKTRSQLSVPIKIGEKVIGVLSVEHILQKAFGQEDVKRLELLAAQAALAIQNARQYEALQKAYQKVQETRSILAGRTALAWTGMISSTWRHAIEKHAITIREQVELLRTDLRELPMKEALEKRLAMMERLANQILIKPLTAPLGSEEGVQSLPVNKFIEKRLKQLWAHEPYKAIERELNLDLDDHATVRANPDWLQRAIDILIDNAADATDGLPNCKILVATRKTNRRAIISISDNGFGIAEEIQEKLFREPITKQKDAKGLGMGLLFAQMILQTYSGKIRIGSTGSKGTTLVISLPLESQPSI